MKLTLKKINQYDNNKMLQLSIDVEYGFEENNYADILKLNINKEKNNIYVTVKIDTPGIGLVVDRIVQLFSRVDKSLLSPAYVIEKLAEHYGMEYTIELLEKLGE